MVIGGGQLYREALSIAQTVYLTEVDNDLEGDTSFPALDASSWLETLREPHAKDDRNRFNYCFTRHERK
jgi:dihydrofolate reductase